MNDQNIDADDSFGDLPEPTGLMGGTVSEEELDIYSEFFRDFSGLMGADNCNKFIHAVAAQVKQGHQHGLHYLLTIQKTFQITGERLDLTDAQERELFEVTMAAAPMPYDEPLAYEPSLLDEEQVEFAWLVADAIFQTGHTVENVISQARAKSLQD